MKHFLEIAKLTPKEIHRLISRAMAFKHQAAYPSFPKAPLANLFYENSTRTRVSFELAAKRLGMPVVHLELQSSSESKGEVILDTIQTLSAMGVRVLVIRHSKEGLVERLALEGGEGSSIINAGDGTHAHPSQAMLDLMTILEHKPDLSQLKIAVVGNLRHSRVANSLQQAFALMNVGRLMLIAPSLWAPERMGVGHYTESLQEGLKDADVVIALRVQKERLLADEQMDLALYHQSYGITRDALKVAKKDVVVMHPGPINRGVEIDGQVANGSNSLILQQVQNGVFMRMAILEYLLL